MKSKQAVLEYCVESANPGRKRRWGFRFKAHDGRILMDSRGGYSSLNHAERGFVSMVKSIAANQYAVASPRPTRSARGDGPGRGKAAR